METFDGSTKKPKNKSYRTKKICLAWIFLADSQFSTLTDTWNYLRCKAISILSTARPYTSRLILNLMEIWRGLQEYFPSSLAECTTSVVFGLALIFLPLSGDCAPDYCWVFISNFLISLFYLGFGLWTYHRVLHLRWPVVECFPCTSWQNSLRSDNVR